MLTHPFFQPPKSPSRLPPSSHPPRRRRCRRDTLGKSLLGKKGKRGKPFFFTDEIDISRAACFSKRPRVLLYSSRSSSFLAAAIDWMRNCHNDAPAVARKEEIGPGEGRHWGLCVFLLLATLSLFPPLFSLSLHVGATRKEREGAESKRGKKTHLSRSLSRLLPLLFLSEAEPATRI